MKDVRKRKVALINVNGVNFSIKTRF
jgi:hypothetical protein